MTDQEKQTDPDVEAQELWDRFHEVFQDSDKRAKAQELLEGFFGLYQASTPDLNPGYKPAMKDSRLIVDFVGNTAQIGATEFIDVDPFQMIGLAEYLKMKAFQFIQTAEMAEARRLQQEQAEEEENKGKIEVATHLPPGRFAPKG